MSNRVLDWVDVELGARMSDWETSARGNYWRMWKGYRLLVYEVREFWYWGVVKGRKMGFSNRGYCSANDAAEALWTHLGVEP